MAGRKNQNSPIGSPLSGNVSDSSSNNKEQDQFLPIANVGRIMKKALPANAKISKEAKETVQECVSEFISFITGEASDKCQKEKRKTINGDDLQWAMNTLGFENYVNPLKLYLNKYRENEGDNSSISMVKEEDHQLPLSNVNSSQQIFQGTADNHHSIPTWPNSQATGNGHYSFDANLTSKTHGNASRVLGYGENTMMMTTGAHNIAKIHEFEGNANRVLTTNILHHGVGW